MKRTKKERKKKSDKRLDLPEWRQYLSDPDSIPTYRDDCPCPKKKCERHDKCRECYAYHAAGKKLPYCIR